jgi:hypothetical protein
MIYRNEDEMYDRHIKSIFEVKYQIINIALYNFYTNKSQ